MRFPTSNVYLLKIAILTMIFDLENCRHIYDLAVSFSRSSCNLISLLQSRCRQLLYLSLLFILPRAASICYGPMICGYFINVNCLFQQPCRWKLHQPLYHCHLSSTWHHIGHTLIAPIQGRFTIEHSTNSYRHKPLTVRPSPSANR